MITVIFHIIDYPVRLTSYGAGSDYYIDDSDFIKSITVIKKHIIPILN